MTRTTYARNLRAYVSRFSPNAREIFESYNFATQAHTARCYSSST
ncbi:MAG: hypothetical protein ACR2GH_08235 [Pseudonocardia sp.]